MPTMTTPEPGRIARVVRGHILTRYRADSCIASTKAVLAVCRYFGIEARPQAVRAGAWNAEGWALYQAGVPTAEWPPEAWAVGIAGQGRHDGAYWDGHLVAVTPGYLIDASLDQFDRPAHGIRLEAAAFALPDDGWPAGDDLRAGSEDGTVLVYQRLDDQEWRDTPNWRDTATLRAVTGAAIRELRE